MQTAATNTMNSIQNSQTVQNLANGPVADKARTEAANTRNEFSNLAASRQTPSVQTATGQNLTHYHSLFYSLLSWENPRATAISFATIVSAILIVRFIPVERFVLKAIFTVLGVTSAAELVGHFVHAVDGEVDALRAQLDERDADLGHERFGRPRGRGGANIFDLSLPQKLADAQNRVTGGAAGAEPERHTGLDVLNGLPRGLLFKRFSGHGVVYPSC